MDVKKKILIVEDDQFLREFYQDLLQSEGYSVDVAADGETGLNKALAGGWGLLLLDLMLPKRDGLQILKEIKVKLSPSTTGVIVILTNLGQDAIIKQCLDLGAAGYLVKSAMNPDQVLTEIHSYLEKA